MGEIRPIVKSKPHITFKFNGIQIQTNDQARFGYFLVMNGIQPGSINIEEFIEIVKEKLMTQRNEKELPMDEVDVYIRDNCTLYMDSSQDNKYIVYDNNLKKLSPISPTVYVSRLGYKSLNPVLATLAKTVYNPYEVFTSKVLKYSNMGGTEITHINLHSFPNWRHIHVEKLDKTKISLILEFLNHLFPELPARKYVLNWMRHMVYNRARTVLCLNSGKGAGKTMLAGLCKALVGKDNAKQTQKNFLESPFNAAIEHTRFMFLDEQQMTTYEQEDAFKKLCNDFQPIHKKGKDAKETIEVYYSIMIASNREIDLRLSYDDRRFSVPEMTDTDLSTVWDDDKRGRLAAIFSDSNPDDEVLAHFGKYLFDECDFGFNSEKPWKGEKFKRICDLSMFEYERFIFDKIANSVVNDNRFEILYDDLMFEYRDATRKTLSNKLITSFIKKPYRGVKYATNKNVGGKLTIVVDKSSLNLFSEYLKETYELEDDEPTKPSKGSRL